jgi:Flp pilus assembly pilin Flp
LMLEKCVCFVQHFVWINLFIWGMYLAHLANAGELAGVEYGVLCSKCCTLVSLTLVSTHSILHCCCFACTECPSRAVSSLYLLLLWSYTYLDTAVGRDQTGATRVCYTEMAEVDPISYCHAGPSRPLMTTSSTDCCRTPALVGLYLLHMTNMHWTSMS